MASADRSIACAIGFAASIIAAGLAAGGDEQGYFVIVLGLFGYVVFGLLLLKLIVGTAHAGQVLNFMFSSSRRRDDADE